MTSEADELRNSELGRRLAAVGEVADAEFGFSPAFRRRQHRNVRRLAPVLMAAGVLVAAAGAGATLLFDDEAKEFARDANVSRQAASQALADQTRLPELDRQLRRALPSEYAGAWVASDGITRVVGIAEGYSVAVASRVSSAAREAGLGSFRFRWNLDSSLVALETEQSRIQRQIDRVNAGASDGVEVEPDVPNNRLIMHLPESPSAAQARVIGKIGGASRVDIDLRRGTPRLIYR